MAKKPSKTKKPSKARTPAKGKKPSKARTPAKGKKPSKARTPAKGKKPGKPKAGKPRKTALPLSLDEAPGWHAIDAACDHLYPDQTEPFHVASVPHPPIGDGLLYGISCYRAADPEHWHFVTYGFSELYAKESDDAAISGWGFELTFRLIRGDEKLPPNWPFDFLMNLGRYVRQSGNPFGPNHVLDLNGPIAAGVDTAIRAIAFVPDPQLGSIDTPNGEVEFLQVVGLTTDEQEACGDWDTEPVIGLLRETSHLLVTDLERQSIRTSPAAAKQIEAGIDRDGSSSPLMYVSVVEWTVHGKGATRNGTLVLGTRAVQSLLPKLNSRLGHGRDFVLIGRDQAVTFRPGAKPGWKVDRGSPVITLDQAALTAVRDTLEARQGQYEWPELPGLVVEVRP